jgi:ethanolamine ammonia-lyase small subunit
MSGEVINDSWQRLKRFTPARVALGRTGSSLPTSALLDFDLAHAQARDAVHAPFHAEQIVRGMEALGLPCLQVHSAAADRAQYLRRPDLGRKLNADSVALLQKSQSVERPELVFVVADGLSAIASERYAVSFVAAMRNLLNGWRLGPLVIAQQARVALGDEIGELLRTEIVVVLIGERPGLSASDSMGAYLTYEPVIGKTDAQRNCLSNIRGGGLSCELAAHRLFHLVEGARRLRLTGVALKDESSSDDLYLPAKS